MRSLDIRADGHYESAGKALEAGWPWPHFSPAEVACKGSGELKVVPDFLDIMEMLRHRYSKPMVVNSWYRSPAYNTKVSNTGTNGPHTTGRAVDIHALGHDRYWLLRHAIDLGFTGIGVGKTFLHLDVNLDDPHLVSNRPAVWVY